MHTLIYKLQLLGVMFAGTLSLYSMQPSTAAEPVDRARDIMLERILASVKAPVLSSREGEVTLESVDNKKVKLARPMVELSQTIAYMLSDTEIDSKQAIQLPQVAGLELSLVSKSLQAIASIADTKTYPQALIKALSPLFSKIGFARLINTLEAANYLDIKVMVKYIAALIVVELITNLDIDKVVECTKLIEATNSDVRKLIFEALEQAVHELIVSLLWTNLKVLKGHTQRVKSVVINPNGRYALTSSVDNTARYWNLESGETIKVLQGHTGYIDSVSISLDGNYALTGSLDKTARYWNLETGEPITILNGHTDDILSVAISPDGKYALTGSYDNTARYWDLSTSQTIKILIGHTGYVKTVAISPDGKHALTGSKDTTARYWDLETGETIKVLKGHTDWVTSVAFSPDGKFALTGSLDNTARYWDLETGNIIKVLEGHTRTIWSVAFSPDGKFALTGSKDNTVRYWNLEAGKTVKELKGHTAGVTSVAISLDGKYALTGSWDTTARYWGIPSTDKLTVPLLVLLSRLDNSITKDAVLNNAYFKDVLDKAAPEVQQKIKQHFDLQ